MLVDFHDAEVRQKTEKKTFLEKHMCCICHVLPTDVTAALQILLLEIVYTAELQKSDIPSVKMEDTKSYV